MKRSFVVLGLGIALGGLVQQAQASTGEIGFEGEVTAETCYAKVNGGTASQNNASATIALPSVGVNTLPAIGSTAGTTRFTIQVSADAAVTQPCVATFIPSGLSATEVYAFIEAGPENNIAGRLVNLNETGNVAGHAEHVALELLNNQSTPIIAGASGPAPWTAQNSTVATMAAALSPGLVHYVRYYAEQAPIVAGKVKGKAVFSLAYK